MILTFHKDSFDFRKLEKQLTPNTIHKIINLINYKYMTFYLQ